MAPSCASPKPALRERGWAVAVLEEAYQDHVTGWDYYLPRIAERAVRQVAST